MSKKKSISNLSATYADVRRLDVKKINLKGKNILEYIEESTPTIKHSQDTRETVTENDLWGQWVETESDGTIIIHDDWVTNPNSPSAWNSSITKVESNKAYTSSGFYANIQLEKIKKGYRMFYNTAITQWNNDLPNLTEGEYMFDNCDNLKSFSTDLPSLTYGEHMFNGCDNLTTFTSVLPSLTDGNCMFYGCTNLNSFSSDLPNLTNGNYMFKACTNLTSFSSDLSSLTYGGSMFYGCTNLTSFSSDLSSLTDGRSMFNNCTNLTSFSSDLSSLTYGYSMFNSCKIDAESVMYIADTIKDITAEKQLYSDGTIPGTIPYVTSSNDGFSAPRGFMSDGTYVYTYNQYDWNSNRVKPYTTTIYASSVGRLTLGINVSNNADTIQQQLEDFAKEATFASWADLKQHFVDKGWTVTFQYGGTTTNITLSEDEQFRGVPVYARLIEVSDENKDTAEYCTEDGTKFYNIDWGHDVTNYDDYQYFGSLLEACGYFGVIPVKYLEEK